eukprot:jgi/Mesen1/8315/ME000457S07510
MREDTTSGGTIRMTTGSNAGLGTSGMYRGSTSGKAKGLPETKGKSGSSREKRTSGQGRSIRKKRKGRLYGRVERRVLGLVVLGLFIFLVWFVARQLPGGTRVATLLRWLHLVTGLVLSDMGASCWSSAASAGEVVADITTKGLYDRIKFEDKEGGVWRQGWDVTYKGDEWDVDKLRVFVVPHSHNDPGWLQTVEQYYQAQTRHILDNVVDALKNNPERRFIWEEMSYLERWWRDASPERRADFTRLARSGQLEVVGGGWVMNDEANTHFFAIIDQISEGNTWLHDTVGVVPRNAWAIDPFGHSPSMAYINRRAGVRRMLIQRTHYEVKKALALEQSLEFMWRQHWDPSPSPSSSPAAAAAAAAEAAAARTGILCHMMPFYSYDVPHTCGPDPSVCCQFDFARTDAAGTGFRCPWMDQPRPITDVNVHERAFTLLDQYRKKAQLFMSNVLLVPLGDDFRYAVSAETELQFASYEKLLAHMNAQPDWKVDARFGTLDDYFAALETTLMGMSLARGGAAAPGALLPSLAGDFFTYSDRQEDYWSGYYTTRPFWKAVDRVLEASLRGAEALFTLCRAHQPQTRNASAFPFRFAEDMTYARRQLAVFQHHDGVTGTAKDAVVVDYGRRMHSALTKLQTFTRHAVAALLDSTFAGGGGDGGVRFEAFDAEQVRSKQDVLPAQHTIQLRRGEARRVVLYNSLEETLSQLYTASEGTLEALQSSPLRNRDTRLRCRLSAAMPANTGCHALTYAPSTHTEAPVEWSVAPSLGRCAVASDVRPRKRGWLLTGVNAWRPGVCGRIHACQVVAVMVDSPEVCVLDGQIKFLAAQISPEWKLWTGGKATGRHRLHFRADVPPLGLQTFFLASPEDFPGCPPAVRAEIEVHNTGKDFTCPEGHECASNSNDTKSIEVSNGRIRAVFSPYMGDLRYIQVDRLGVIRKVQEEIATYSTSASGAYLFVPAGKAVPAVFGGGPVLVVRGPLVQEVHWEPRFASKINWAKEEHGPPVALLLQRRGWDCSFGTHEGYTERHLACTPSDQGYLNLGSIFETRPAVSQPEVWPLNLVRAPESLKEEEDSPKLIFNNSTLILPDDDSTARRRLVVDASRKYLRSPLGGSAAGGSAGSGVDPRGGLTIDRMEIVAVKFELQLRRQQAHEFSLLGCLQRGSLCIQG